ncbi:hypothetical protein ACFCXF_12135 [Streptomyces virginiae]|uniref:hypothetical protein n=1 Tax=Streptomyces virginiae TaxID=1961 RepID=UPI0035D88120
MGLDHPGLRWIRIQGPATRHAGRAFPGTVVEAAASYAFTCEERHMHPTPGVTDIIRNADVV